MKPIKDLTGLRFGRLTVIGRECSRPGMYWIVECDCGTRKILQGSLLKRGRSRSCGCLRTELLTNRFTKHGNAPAGKQSREYTTWVAIKARCLNLHNPGFKNYGARSITMCERWNTSFDAFLSDMGECPAGFSIERKDNNGNYEPGNCIWADRFIQANNTRNNKWITVEGVTKTYSQWERHLGLKPTTISHRIRNGATPQEVIL